MSSTSLAGRTPSKAPRVNVSSSPSACNVPSRMSRVPGRTHSRLASGTSFRWRGFWNARSIKPARRRKNKSSAKCLTDTNAKFNNRRGVFVGFFLSASLFSVLLRELNKSSYADRKRQISCFAHVLLQARPAVTASSRREEEKACRNAVDLPPAGT